MKRRFWTAEEIKIVQNEYYGANKTELAAKLNRTWVAVKVQANKLGLRRAHEAYFTTTVHRLLEETPEAYYWIGLILADGHIQPRGQLNLTLAIKDATQVEKLARYLGCSVSYAGKSTAGLAVMDVVSLRSLSSKFGITNHKTTDPVNLPKNISDALLLSLIIGFIDGDGHVGYQFGRRDVAIRLKCHENWLSVLQFMTTTINRLSETSMPLGVITSTGYASCTWSDGRAIKMLKQFALDHKLPCLNRKWDKIDLTRISKVELAAQRLKQAIDLKEKGWKQQDIAKKLNMSNGGVSTLLSRNGVLWFDEYLAN